MFRIKNQDTVEMWGSGYWLPHVQPTRDSIDGEALAD